MSSRMAAKGLIHSHTA